MQRKFNYTGRKKIARPRASVTCKTHESGHYAYDILFDLREMELPKDTSIFVEAYYRTAYMRFGWGTVGNIQTPHSTLIDNIDQGVIPFFRVKVVKAGKILAAADRIRPTFPVDAKKEKTSLLPVEFEDLGEMVWKLDIDDEPVLILNNSIEGISEMARSEPAFLSLVYPEIIRQILYKIVLQTGYTDDEDDWENRWVFFAVNLGVPTPPEGVGAAARNEQEQWIDDAVNAFARKIKARKILAKAIIGDAI